MIKIKLIIIGIDLYVIGFFIGWLDNDFDFIFN